MLVFANVYIGHEEGSSDSYGRDHSPPYSPPPMGPNAGYPPEHQEFYPSSNTFPPPPTNYAREGEYAPEYPPYNPNDYPPPPGETMPDPNLGYPQPNETYAGDSRYEHGHHDRPGPENVSPNFDNGEVDDPHGACS